MTEHMQGRMGIGYDIHRLVSGRPLWIGGVEIPFDMGLLGHSDGDALCHAIADALLGAVGLGEIGILFPDSDPRFLGITGNEILRDVTARVTSAGLQIGNIDAIIVAERPVLAPHREEIRQAIAIALAIEPVRVSIKIKSNEGCDSIGRGEAIAAQAVAWVEPA